MYAKQKLAVYLNLSVRPNNLSVKKIVSCILSGNESIFSLFCPPE